MLRFVDVRGQMLGGRFAFFDTAVDLFEVFNGVSVWDTWEEFAEDCHQDIKRHKALCPSWVFVGGEDA